MLRPIVLHCDALDKITEVAPWTRLESCGANFDRESKVAPHLSTTVSLCVALDNLEEIDSSQSWRFDLRSNLALPSQCVPLSHLEYF